MNTSEERYMIAIAEEKTLRKAAARAGVSQPLLSKWLNSREDELKLQLFARARGKLELTEAGQIYLDACREILRLSEEAQRELARTEEAPVSSIRFGGSETTGVNLFARVYGPFRQRYPGCNPEFRYGTARELDTALQHQRIDLMMLLQTEKDSERYQFFPIGMEELVVVRPREKSHADDPLRVPALGELPSVRFGDLQDYPLYLGAAPFYNALLPLLEQKGLGPNIALRSNSLLLRCRLAIAGNGAALVPLSCLDPPLPASVARLDPPIRLFAGIASHRYRQLSEEEQYFLSLARDVWQASSGIKEKEAVL